MILEAVSFIYILLICIVYAVIPGRGRVYLLSAASLVYVLYVDLLSGIVLLGITLFVWGFALWIGKLKEQGQKNKAVLFLAVSVTLLALAVLIQKTPFIMMFVGFSFYGFQAISYLADVYLSKIRPDKNPVSLFLYLSYFPKLISGPIEKKGDFDRALERIEKLKFRDFKRLGNALMFIVFGVFLKMVVADRLFGFTSKIFAAFGDYESFTLVLGAVFYTFEIYCDFAGYSYMAYGISQLFGIEINLNFKTPYCVSNITDFWRCWHISLSSFLKDYIYIPLGGNRKGFLNKLLFVGIVFITCGLWHGFGLSFLVWGILHALYSVIDNIFGRYRIEWIRKGIIGRILTFVSVSFAWIFFNSESLTDALGYIGHMFSCGIDINYFAAGFLAQRRDIIELGLAVFLIVLVVVMDEQSHANNEIWVQRILKRKLPIKCIVFFALLFTIIVFGVYGPNYNSADFIYMQF